MTRINLLPWRELRRRQLSAQLLRGSIGAWLLMGLLVGYVHWHFGGLIKDQQGRNDYLSKEITKLDKEIAEIKEIREKREELISRINVIQQLQKDRSEIVHVMDDLVYKLPRGLYLTLFQKNQKNILLKGTAHSNARVSSFMRQLDESDWYNNPSLDVINVKQIEGRRVSNFTLRVRQTSTTPAATDDSS